MLYIKANSIQNKRNHRADNSLKSYIGGGASPSRGAGEVDGPAAASSLPSTIDLTRTVKSFPVRPASMRLLTVSSWAGVNRWPIGTLIEEVMDSGRVRVPEDEVATTSESDPTAGIKGTLESEADDVGGDLDDQGCWAPTGYWA